MGENDDVNDGGTGAEDNYTEMQKRYPSLRGRQRTKPSTDSNGNARPDTIPGLPRDTALYRVAEGVGINVVEAAVDGLAGLMVEFEQALDAAEQREARINARRRRANRTTDQVGRGR